MKIKRGMELVTSHPLGYKASKGEILLLMMYYVTKFDNVVFELM